MILFEFECDECKHTFSDYVKSDVKGLTCRKCEGKARRILSPVRSKLEGVSGDFPGAAMKWDREHIKAGRQG